MSCNGHKCTMAGRCRHAQMISGPRFEQAPVRFQIIRGATKWPCVCRFWSPLSSGNCNAEQETDDAES